MEQSQKGAPIDIFISHKHSDAPIAKALIELLRSATGIKAQRIRCTSVPGYELPAGVLVNEHLRNESTACPIFIALITRESLKSQYVLFEMGARWGSKQRLIPLLAAGVNSSELESPLNSLELRSCDKPHDLQQLVIEIASTLQLVLESPVVYENEIERLRELSHREASGGSPAPPEPGTIKPSKGGDAEERNRRNLRDALFTNKRRNEWKSVKPAANRVRISEDEALRLLHSMSDVEVDKNQHGEHVVRKKARQW